MRNYMRIFMDFIILSILVLVGSCVSGRSSQEQPVPAGNPWLGSWEAIDKDGIIYSVEFFETEWVSYLETDGMIMPVYKGFYIYDGLRVDLQIIDELNTDTMGWVRSKEIYSPVTSRMINNTFKLFFTNADFSRF